MNYQEDIELIKDYKMNNNFHDAEILGIEKSNQSKLILKVCLQNKKNLNIIFHNAVWWKLSPFEIENILYDKIIEYKKNNIPQEITNILQTNINNEFINFILNGKYNVYSLIAIHGCEGIIIASEINYINN